MKSKIIYIFISFLWICLFISCKTIKNPKSDEYYKIIKIDSINSYYIVYIKGGEAQYKIVSKKEKALNCRPIKVGEGYPIFILEKLIIREQYIPKNYIYEIANPNIFVPDCIKMDDNKTEVCRDQGLDNIYKTSNLKGLCYVDVPLEKEKKFFLPPLKLNH